MIFRKNLKEINMTFLVIIISYALIILIPIHNQVMVRGRLFGYDVGQYLLTARSLVEGKENMFKYPYPLVPLLYIIPTLILRDSLTLYVFGLYVSGFLMVLITYVMYNLLKNFIKTDIARAVSLLFFGSFPLTLDIVGWGGQSTLVAVLLGLSSIAFMINYLIYSKARFLILSSLTLLLSTLSEPYVSMYFLTVLGILTLWKTKYYSFKKLFREITPLTPPLLIIAFTALRTDVHRKVLTPLAIYIVTNPNVLSELLSRLTFGCVEIYLAVIIIIVTYLVLRFVARMQNLSDDIPIVASSTIALFIQVLITPAQYADRGLFLSSIPLSIMLGRVVDCLGYSQVKRFAPLLLTTLLLALLTSGTGVCIYRNSIEYYFIDKDLLNITSFIYHEEGNVLFISPHPLSFPLSYITDKDVYSTTQPVWFIRDSQINASILAMSLAWGIRWIDAGEVRIVDSTPVWAQPSPAIYIARYPYYVELFRLSDALMPIVFSPTNNESIIWRESPFYAREIKTWNTNASMFSIYKYDTLIIEKTINVDNNGVINIVLSYNFTNSFPHEIVLRFISLMLSDTKALIISNNDSYAQVRLLQSFREPWIRCYYNTTIEVYTLSSNVKVFAEFIEQDEWGLPEVVITLRPINMVNEVVVLFKILVNDIKVSPPRVVLEYEALEREHIRWVVIDKGVHPDIIQRFLRDPIFEVYLNSSKYIIFRLK